MGTAFAVPVVSSFSMAGISAVSAQADQSNGVINCNSTTIYTANSSGQAGSFPPYGRTPTGNIPVCGTPHGILGFLQTIFSLGHKPL